MIGFYDAPNGVDGFGAGGDWPPGAMYRTEVYQATGMVGEQLAVSPATALSVLRAHAFLHGRDIAEVARDVVARRIRMNEET